MWANHCALVTLNTFRNLPFRNIYSNTAFFISSSAGWECAVSLTHQLADRKLVAFLHVHRSQDFINPLVTCLRMKFFIFSLCPSSRNFYLLDSSDTLVNSCIVHRSEEHTSELQ